MKKTLIAMTLPAALMACGEAPEPEPEACDQATAVAELFGTHTEPSSPAVTFETEDTFERVVLDASFGGPANAAQTSYAYLDLDTSTVLPLSDAEALTDAEWDVAFNRSLVRLNGGDSGPGQLSLARVDDTTWEDASAPTEPTPWAQDDVIDEQCERVTFGQGFLATAFGQWYDYDFVTHEVSVIEDTVFFVHDGASDTVTKLQIEAYEDGVYTIRWR
jgi:hypothetical protein